VEGERLLVSVGHDFRRRELYQLYSGRPVSSRIGTSFVLAYARRDARCPRSFPSVSAMTGSPQADPAQETPHVVIVGGGFGGLYAARALSRAAVRITLIDRRNFHLFQPLLYQVATGGLSPADIAAPLRAILKRQTNLRVLQDQVRDVDVDTREVVLEDERVRYDFLILATGATHHYFGNDAWAKLAPGLKTVEDATSIRADLLKAFERAEREEDPSFLSFAIIGGGPTGVELAGAIGELAHHTLRGNFRTIDAGAARILLLEAADRVLTTYPEDLSRRATEALTNLGVQVHTETKVADIKDGALTVETHGETTTIHASVIVWAAGVKASPLGARLGADVDRAGRVLVERDLAVIGRGKAVALLWRLSFWGYPAWLLWLFVHLMYLVAFENRLIVFIQWAWSYFTKNRRARLITQVPK
jgi:NADH dehydrogenase